MSQNCFHGSWKVEWFKCELKIEFCHFNSTKVTTLHCTLLSSSPLLHSVRTCTFIESTVVENTKISHNLCVKYQKPILPPLDNYMSPDNRQNYFMAFLISSVAIIIQSLLLFWSCLQSPVLYDTWPWHWCTSHVTCHVSRGCCHMTLVSAHHNTNVWIL